jgi:hypothetical protein
LTFSLRKLAKARAPGLRETVARERTTAAYASRGEPSRRKEPSAQLRDLDAMATPAADCFFSAPPQPTRRVRLRPSAGMTARARTTTEAYRRKRGVKFWWKFADNI